MPMKTGSKKTHFQDKDITVVIMKQNLLELRYTFPWPSSMVRVVWVCRM